LSIPSSAQACELVPEVAKLKEKIYAAVVSGSGGSGSGDILLSHKHTK